MQLIKSFSLKFLSFCSFFKSYIIHYESWLNPSLIIEHFINIIWYTLESVWEPPEEGYMTFAEQEEEAKEETVQRELMEQLDKEEATEKADILEEQRANIEREKLREFRKRPVENDDTQGDDESTEIKKEVVEEERPYWRDYSVPERPQPYGSWQIVKSM